MNFFKWIIILGPVTFLMVRNSTREYMGDSIGIYNALLNCLPLVILFIVNLKRNRPNNIFSILIRSTFYIYLYYLFKYTIFYIPYFDYFTLKAIYSFKDIPIYINLIPFKTILGNVTLYQTIGNLFLLFPLGIYLPLINLNFRKIRLSLFMGFITTLFIEFVQLIVSITHALYSDYPYTRGADIDDLILNMSGYIIGYLLSLILLLPFRDLVEGNFNRLQRSKSD